MSGRRRVGASAATTEAARRQLMIPVECTWERKWVPLEGTSLKVYRWTKAANKPQELIDVEDDAPLDAPLRPLADNEVEMVEIDDEDEVVTSAPTPAVVVDPTPLNATPEKVAPIPDEQATQLAEDDMSLTGLEDIGGSTSDSLGFVGGPGGIDLSSLGPDGLPYEGAPDMSQMEEEDVLLGGSVMDDSMGTFNEELSKA